MIDDGDIKILHGDALEQLATLPSESVHMIMTSPPFWALRDYGTGTWSGGDEECDHQAAKPSQEPEDAKRRASELQATGRGKHNRDAGGPGQHGGWEGRASRSDGRAICKCGARRVDNQIGLEATPEEWCARLVDVFRECRRVLRSDGVMWLECGDTYSGSAPGNVEGVSRASGLNGADGAKYRETLKGSVGTRRSTLTAGVKPKDLVGAPWMLAFALRADGWYLRSDTIWARPNPMPESVTDRPTKAHSYVFLLTKSARYFYDADAIREVVTSEASIARNRSTPRQIDRAAARQPNGDTRPRVREIECLTESGRNARSVWSIATEPTPFAHFATFPQALVERCIKAGTSEHGCCAECGAPWVRTVEKGEPELRAWSAKGAGHVNQSGSREEASTLKHAVPRETTGWEPTCGCRVRDYPGHDGVPYPCLPCVCLDPFMGSGTTALVARRLGRHAIGIELNAEYIAIAATRLQQLSLLGGAA